MAILNEVISEEVTQGATFSLEDRVTVIPFRSGFEQRVALWDAPRRTYSVAYGQRPKALIDEISRLNMAAGGQLDGFLFFDWNDFQVIDEPLDPIPDEANPGFATQWRIVKRYGTRRRRIRYAVPGTFSFSPDSPFRSGTLDYDTGIVTLGTQRNINEELPVNCEFYVPVRFAEPAIDVVINWIANASIPSLELIEIIGEDG